MSLEQAELEAFAELVSAVGQLEPRLATMFAGAPEIVVARAPGRLDVMGGFADYSGSLVLELPLGHAALVAAAQTGDDWVRCASMEPHVREVRLPAGELYAACRSFESARDYFRALPESERWCAYVAGTLAALRLDYGVTPSGGLRLLLRSNVPEGAGVSSSAAIEVASLRALLELFGVAPGELELALSCQRVENRVVGAPCGVMDQVTSACGQAGRLLALLCRPAELRDSLALPSGLALFGIDSGVRHAVAGGDYGRVRTATFMGYRILAECLGAKVVAVAPGRVRLEADPLAGYLTRLTPEQLDGELVEALPQLMTGREFLDAFTGVMDGASQIQADAEYRVRAATLHPIAEHARVQRFAELLRQPAQDQVFEELGAMMRAAHAGYGACGLGSDATDRLVELVMEQRASGLFGAKASGGGSGGTVVVLGRPEARAALDSIVGRFRAETARRAQVLEGSSDGALRVSPLRRRLAS